MLISPNKYIIIDHDSELIFETGLLTNKNELLKIILKEDKYILHKISQSGKEWFIFVTSKMHI